MKKLFLFLVCFCSLVCFAQVDEQKELFSYKFIEENLLPVDGDPPPPPKYYNIFFVKLNNDRIWCVLDLYTLWSLYAYDYKENSKEYSSLSHFLYEVLNFKKKLREEHIAKYGRGKNIIFFPDVKMDYKTLTFEQFKKKYIKKFSDKGYMIREEYKKSEIEFSIYYFLYLNRAYFVEDSGIGRIYIYFYEKEKQEK